MIKFLFAHSRIEKDDNNNAKKNEEANIHDLDRTSFVNKGFISWPKRYRFLAGPRRKISKGKMCTSFRLE